MIALLWTALNVVLLILFFYAWIRVAKVLGREIGAGFALLFMLGLLSFGGKGSSPDGNHNLLAPQKPKQELGNWRTTQNLPLNSHNQLSVVIEAQRTDSTTHPVGLYTGVSGLIVGHNWKPIGGLAYSRKQKVHYQVDMLHEWKLLGFSLYTSYEEYSGSVPNANAR